MRKVLLALLLMLAIAPPSFAEKSKGKVKIEIKQSQNYKPTVHRAPACIDIEAYYDTATNTIDIMYGGEAEGEVYLYLNNTVVGYDTEINTSFQVSEPGLYTIEISTESWIAEGCLEI